MEITGKQHIGRLLRWLPILFGASIILIFSSNTARSETYGVKDSEGNFIAKANITFGNKEISIRKINPQEKFRSITITLNQRNSNLVRNLGLLTMEWFDAANRPGKPMPFAGTRYDPSTRKFEDSMGKSVELKLVDKSAKNLFAGKPLSELFSIYIDDEPLVSSESVAERDKTIQLGSGRDVSLNIDKRSIVFNESNLKKGEIINIDNRSGTDQIIGVESPEKGLLYYQIIRKPEQTKVPRDTWHKFTLAPESGIFIVIIPESDPIQLAQLNNKELQVRIYQGNKTRETIRIPIRTSANSRQGIRDTDSKTESFNTPSIKESALTGDTQAPKAGGGSGTRFSGDRNASRLESSPAESSGWFSWSLSALLVLCIGVLAGYTIFFVLPKVQSLEDRVAKNEMFLHLTRDQLKEEIERLRALSTGEEDDDHPEST
jgi:hypothetical protein